MSAVEAPPMPEVPPAPIPAHDPAPAAAPASADAAETPLANWADVLAILADTCPPLFGVLQGSAASMRGDMVLIQTENALFRTLVTRDGNKQQLMEAVMRVTGKKCRIGLKKVTKPTTPADDPLAAFIQNARNQGVEVEVKE